MQATTRPWYHFVRERVIARSEDPNSESIATTERDEDAVFIVEAVNAYDTLRAQLATVTAERDAAEAKRDQWAKDARHWEAEAHKARSASARLHLALVELFGAVRFSDGMALLNPKHVDAARRALEG